MKSHPEKSFSLIFDIHSLLATTHCDIKLNSFPCTLEEEGSSSPKRKGTSSSQIRV